MRFFQSVSLGVFLMGILLVSCTAPEPFDRTFEAHMSAIQNRDFAAFSATITRQDSIIFILPNGALTESTSRYREMIKGWFEEENWRLSYKVVRKIRGTDLSMALVLVSYDEDDRNGKPYHLDHYLALTFQKEDGEWRLVHDQNTGIPSD